MFKYLRRPDFAVEVQMQLPLIGSRSADWLPTISVQYKQIIPKGASPCRQCRKAIPKN